MVLADLLIFSRSEKMNSKVFAERFNRELVSFNLPDEPSDKIKAISKVFEITRHLANSLVLGYTLPSEEQLDRIARILEVCPDWLCGNVDKKKAYSRRETEMA